MEEKKNKAGRPKKVPRGLRRFVQEQIEATELLDFYKERLSYYQASRDPASSHYVTKYQELVTLQEGVVKELDRKIIAFSLTKRT